MWQEQDRQGLGVDSKQRKMTLDVKDVIKRRGKSRSEVREGLSEEPKPCMARSSQPGKATGQRAPHWGTASATVLRLEHLAVLEG